MRTVSIVDSIMRKRLPVLLLLLITTAPVSAQQLRLSTLLSDVGDDHPRIRAAMAEIDLQRGRKLQAIAPPSPQVTFHEEEIPTGAALGDGNQRIWQVSQAFDLPMLIGARGYVFGHLQRAAEQRLAVARGMVRADLIAGYATWYARLRQLELQRENHRLAADFARKAQLRYDAGESSALEAARAKAEEASTRVALGQARTALQDAAAGLALAAARDIPFALDPDANAAAVADSLPPVDLALLQQLGEERGENAAASPLLRAAKEERDAARSNASWRWMEFLPRFEAAWFRQDFKDIGPHWGAELTASVPLWFLLDTRGSIEEHSAAARQAEAAYDRSMRELTTAVRKARSALAAAATSMLAYDTDLLREAQRIAHAAEIGYDSGEIGYMEYLAARKAANDILIGSYDAVSALYGAVAQYEFVTGTVILE